jgi:hypothetical protein
MNIFGDLIIDDPITRLDYRIDLFNYSKPVVDKNIIKARANSFEHQYKT